MDKLTIVLVVMLVMAGLALSAKRESALAGKDFRAYGYSKALKLITSGVSIFLPAVLAWTVLFDRLYGAQDAIVLLGFSVFSALAWFFFYRTKVILTDTSIIKVTPFSKKELLYEEVEKIVVYPSPLNPAAAKSRIYGKERISLDALLVDYHELVSELRFRCRRATVIEK